MRAVRYGAALCSVMDQMRVRMWVAARREMQIGTVVEIRTVGRGIEQLGGGYECYTVVE